jgi:Transposase DDE domain/Domain of unknown function (DUF4372)
MHKGKLVFAQLCEHLPKAVFHECVARYAGRYPTLSFSHWNQLLCMMFAQLTSRSSLRDICLCLGSHANKLYHAGLGGPVARSTLADANERRDYRIFEDFALHLIAQARALYVHESVGIELQQVAYAIDSSTIDLCLGLFAWAPATKGRAGIKLHTLLDLRGNIPTVVQITGSRVHDATLLDHLMLEAGSFYVMDRGYMHFARLIRFSQAGAFFVVRSRENLQFQVIKEQPSHPTLGVMCDSHIILKGMHTSHTYPLALRRIEFFIAEQNRSITLLTNHFDLKATQIAQLYKSRWQVELFFKWIKQNLRIKAFVGTSVNAVKTQIWCAICTYVLLAIVKKRLGLEASMHSIAQVLSLSLFERTPLLDLLANAQIWEADTTIKDQLALFGDISGQ